MKKIINQDSQTQQDTEKLTDPYGRRIKRIHPQFLNNHSAGCVEEKIEKENVALFPEQSVPGQHQKQEHGQIPN